MKNISMIAMCILTCATTATASETNNGLQLNGLQLNGLQLNGFTLNSLYPNVITSNGLHFNKLGADQASRDPSGEVLRSVAQLAQMKLSK